MIKIRYLFSFSLLALGLLFFTKNVNAADTVSVAPAFINASVSKKNPIDQQVVSIKNNSDKTINLFASINSVDNQTGKLVPKNEEDKTLGPITNLSQTELKILPNKSINLKIQFNNSESLSPGGHYASLLIRSSDNEVKSGLSFQPIVSVGIYLVKEDGAKRSISIENLNFPSFLFSMPQKINTVFRNDGNVIVTPRASIDVMKGNQIKLKSVVNEGSLPVMPAETLNLESNLKTINNSWLPGKYTINVNYRYDQGSEVKTVSDSFWFVPWKFVLILLFLMALIYWKRKYIKKSFLKAKNSLKKNKNNSLQA